MTRSILPSVALFALPADSSSDSSPRLLRKKPSVDEDSLCDTVDQMPGILWTTDAELRFTQCLGGGLALLGLQPQELVGLTLYDFFQTKDRDFSPLAAHHAALVGQAQAFSFSKDHCTMFGTAEPLFDAAGNPQGTVALAVDISSRQEFEEERLDQLMQGLESRRLHSLKTMASGVAHKFNNLLTGLIGYATLALRDLPAEAPVRAFLVEIDTIAQAAANLAEQMMLFVGREPGVKEFVNFSHLIQDMRPLLQGVLTGQTTLEYDLAPDLPPMEGDRGQLRHLVMSLLVNAAEAIGRGPGVIHVRTQAVHVDGTFSAKLFAADELRDGHFVWLQISDTGCGMDHSVQEQVFDPFFSTKFLGRGLGLAAAQGIVQGHHGALAVSSKPGLGTTIHVFLPVRSSS